MWQNKYVGIPYKDNGRDLDGMDCWGLARHVYNKEFNINLPSFSEDYTGSDRERIAELIAQYKEGWAETTSEPQSGDIVLFRMLGLQSHIGIITEYPYFLHAREGYSSSIERLDSTIWEKRVIGIFRYKEATSNNLVAVPNPLKTTRVTEYIPEGATLHQVYETLHELHGLPEEVREKVTIMVNGRVIPEAEWNYTVQKGDMLEYRAVPRGDVVRIFAVVALVYFTGGIAAGTGMGGAFGASLGLAGGTFASTLVAAGVMAAGMALINKIAPIRPPDPATDPGSAKAQNLINAANNTANPYGSIPVVLGRVRMTPPVGAINYIEPGATESYLRMLLLWGYGPVAIEDIRVGTNALSDYDQNNKTYYGYASESASTLADVNLLYGQDVQQVFKNIKLVGSESGSPWQEITFTQPASEFQVAIYFPQGLRKIKNKGDGAGNIYPAPFVAEIQYDVVGSNIWGSNLYSFAAKSISLQNSNGLAYAGSYQDGSSIYTSMTANYYQWHTIYLESPGGALYSKSGTPTESINAEPSANLKNQIAGPLLAPNLSSMTRIPSIGSSIPLFDVCVYNGNIVQTVKRTEYAHTTTISTSGLIASVSAGTISAPGGVSVNQITIGDTNQEYYQQKDAFTYVKKIVVPAGGVYKIRVRRVNSGAADAADSEYTTLHDAILYTGTAFDSVDHVAVKDPQVGKFARTALRIRATDQLNGSIDAVNALVTSVCPDWDSATGTWITRPTNNPASLMRYVLQHPANAQRISDADLANRVDLAQLQYWHAYCIGKGFTFNTVMNNAKSILDVLRDICAAGRASPAVVDGKWTVIIDEPKTQVIQHFSTHNSWGFEAVKPLVKIPDAFKVIYFNESSNYVQDELYVYNVGKGPSTATVFEEIQLPGVTNAQAATKHARWHLAQLRIRPETYSLNTDMEYLVCNRGDLVRVQHDVPSWGIGTARIKTYVNSLTLILDNDMPLEAGISYVIRIRTATGASITRYTAPVSVPGYYSQIAVTQSLSSTEGAADNLILFGYINTESQQCIVLSVEPSTNGTAKLTLVDYNADIYNIDSGNDYPLPNFNPNISTFPDSFVPVVQQTPTITSVISDESALEVISPGNFRTRIKVNYRETQGQPTLDKTITSVELQWKYTYSASKTWPNSLTYSINNDSFYATDVQEGQVYDLRLRYVRYDGVTGAWTTFTNHTVTGRTTPPSAVTGITYSLLPTAIKLAWNDNPEIDVLYYEVRDSDIGWGTNNAYIFKGGASNLILQPPASGSSTTWYVRAIDSTNLYSKTSASITYGTPAVQNISYITSNYSSSSLTEATVELRWDNVNALFGTAYYELTYNGITKQVLATSIILPANWLGDRSFTVKVVDNLGNKSSGYTATITKLAPNSVVSYKAQVIDNNVLLYWTYGAKTSLPISHVLIKRSIPTGTWASADVLGTKSGEFTSLSEITGGSYIYWIAAVDTDGRESIPIQIPTTVSQPPDFKFSAEYVSTYSGTKSSAIDYAGELFLPVNTTETWQSHFTSRSWSTPQDQITAGYPVFIQPGTTTGYYEEVFDYGTVLASSQITLSATGVDIAGTNTISYTISTSADNVTYTDVGNINAFGTGFRYIKVKIVVTENSAGSIYKITGLRLRLDAKQKTEANTVTVPTTGSKIVNFDTEFIDVQSIILTPTGTTPITAMYDFKDTVITGTYSIASNVATINATAHGLIVGQKVKLYFTTGTAPSGVYTILSVTDANTYTVSITTADTSGNVTTYPNSMIIYTFVSTTGAIPATATVTSYQIKGY